MPIVPFPSMNTSPKISPRSTPLSSIADLVDDLNARTTSSSSAGVGTTGSADGNSLRAPAKRKRSEEGSLRGGRFVVGGAVVTVNAGSPGTGMGTGMGTGTGGKEGKVDYIRFRDVNWSK